MYSVIQFTEKDGGTVSLVNNQWFTPRRCEVFWPPVKGTRAFEKLLADAQTPDEKWKLYSVQRVFCETDDLEKAKKKLKLVEETSDLQTEAETEPSLKRKRQKKYVSSSSDEENDNHIRPPPLKKKTFNKLQLYQAAGNVGVGDYGDADSHQAQPNIAQETASIPERTLSLLNEVDELPVLTNSIPQGLVEDGEGRLTSFARLRSPRCGYEQPSNLGSDVPAPPSNVQGLTGFEDKVLALLCTIKTQNAQMLNLLTDKKIRATALKPEFKFPLKTLEELNTNEELLKTQENYLNVVTYIETLGGRNTSNTVSRVLKLLMADCLAKEFNFYGKRSQKRPFCELLLRNCVVDAVKNTTGATQKEIDDNIKVWLKHAPERLKKDNKQIS